MLAMKNARPFCSIRISSMTPEGVPFAGATSAKGCKKRASVYMHGTTMAYSQ